jgi:hypothetical protein
MAVESRQANSSPSPAEELIVTNAIWMSFT